MSLGYVGLGMAITVMSTVLQEHVHDQLGTDWDTRCVLRDQIVFHLAGKAWCRVAAAPH